MTERFLFEKYKDTAELFYIQDRNRIKDKYPDINFSDLYAKIVQYQIKKYGIQLSKPVKTIKVDAV